MDVYKNKGNPKWMVYFMENPIKIHDLGVPLFLETPILKKPRLFCSIVSDFGLNQVDDFGLCFFFWGGFSNLKTNFFSLMVIISKIFPMASMDNFWMD